MGIQAQTRPLSLGSPTGGIDWQANPGTSSEVPRADHAHQVTRIGAVAAVATGDTVPNGAAVVDGWTVSTGETVLLPSQVFPNTPSGIWLVDTTGPWTSLSTAGEMQIVQVLDLGTEHADSLWVGAGGFATSTEFVKVWQRGSPLFTPYADIGNVTGAVTVEARDGAVQRLVLTGNITVTLDAAVAPDKAQALTLFLVQDGTGSRTVTWPASVRWDSGTAPTLSTGANDVDVIQLLTYDGGTTWYGFEGGLDFSVPA